MRLDINNDASNALMLYKDMEAHYSFWLQMKINEALLFGTRLKYMNKNWFKIKANDLNNSNRFVCFAIDEENRIYVDYSCLIYGDPKLAAKNVVNFIYPPVI